MSNISSRMNKQVCFQTDSGPYLAYKKRSQNIFYVLVDCRMTCSQRLLQAINAYYYRAVHAGRGNSGLNPLVS